jgi:DNA-binding NarL/FixJ family response regulator
MATVAGMTSDRAPIRILIVDDDPLVRRGLALILGGSDELEVIGQADDGESGLAAIRAHRPDVVLMDIRMPVLDGIEATRKIRADGDSCRVIVLTTFGGDQFIQHALAAGADGFLLKDTKPADIVEAVHRVHAGEPTLSPAVVSSLIRQITVRENDTDRREARERLSVLTERERDVATAVGRGFSNAQIARELYLSVPTVKAHISRLLVKLDLENRVQIALLVQQAKG